MNQEAKLKRQWEYLNKLGLYTVEDVIEYDKKLVIKIPSKDERSEVYKLNKRRWIKSKGRVFDNY